MQVPTDSSHPDATGKSFLLFAAVIFTVAIFFYIFKPAHDRALCGEDAAGVPVRTQGPDV